MKARSIALLAFLWRFIKWLWSVLIIGVVVGVLGNVAYTYFTTGTVNFRDPRTLALVSFLLSHPQYFALSLALILLLTLSAFLADRSQRKTLQMVHEKPASKASSQDRQRMLAKVRAFWIKGVLEKSLHGAALIALGLREQSNAIENPWHFVLQQPDYPPQPLPSGTRIIQVYDETGGELLILGEPGSGKTTLLLALARELLDRAGHNDDHPIPVVFNLSSWTVEQKAIPDWLIEELHSKYQVPLKLGQVWVNGDQILPLLDGLDEVDATYREDCIKAINTYRQGHGIVPIVVCSRSADYLNQRNRMLLRAAVVVQPLTRQQIDDYLSSAGERLDTIRVVLQEDPTLQEMAATPLILNILVLAYEGKSVKDFPSTGSPEIRRQKIFERYVYNMLFERRGRQTRYTFQLTLHWLTCLAKQLKSHSQTEFYIERLQPYWLEDSQPRVLFRAIVRLIIGLIAGSAVIWLTGLFGGPIYAWGIGGVISLCFGLFAVIVVGLHLGGNAKIRLYRGITRLVIGLIIGLIVGLIFGLVAGLIVGLGSNAIAGLITGLCVGLVGMLVTGSIVGAKVQLDAGIEPAEVVSWSWSDMWDSFIFEVGFQWHVEWSETLLDLAGGAAIIVVLTGVLLFVPPGIVYDVLAILLSIFLIGGLFSLLVAVGGFVKDLFKALGEALGDGFSSEMLDEHDLVRPNQGIWRSARNSVLFGLAAVFGGGVGCVVLACLTVGLAGGLILGVLGGLVVGLTHMQLSSALGGLLGGLLLGLLGGGAVGLVSGVLIGPIFGLFYGLRVGLLNGGLACIQHIVLRLLLSRAGSIPRNYRRFLDFAAERILLRKVGGGYIFIHRLLLDYFASLGPTPSSSETEEDGQKISTLTVISSTLASATTPDMLSNLSSSHSSAPLSALLESSLQLPCGHKSRPNARFCTVCGAFVQTQNSSI